jgi:hypothetical protein
LKIANKKSDASAPLTHEDVKNYRQMRDTEWLGQEEEPPEPIFKSYVKPFTASPYYDFFDAFLLGLKLETFFSGSDACMMSGVYVVDDYFYLQNNISDF